MKIKRYKTCTSFVFRCCLCLIQLEYINMYTNGSSKQVDFTLLKWHITWTETLVVEEYDNSRLLFFNVWNRYMLYN